MYRSCFLSCSQFISSSWDAFTRWDTAISRSKASWACPSSRIASLSGFSPATSVYTIYGDTASATSTSNKGTIFGFSSRYQSTSSSASPSSMFTLLAYSGVTSLLGPACGCVGILTFVFPLMNVILFFCQFCLIRSVHSHGRPNSSVYAP